MSYEVKETRTYDHSADAVNRLAAEVIRQLGGKLSKKKSADGSLTANFNKKIKGKMFANRCQLEVTVIPQTAEQCQVTMLAYPVDPIGNKLLFGVRGDPARMVVDTFLTDFEAQIG